MLKTNIEFHLIQNGTFHLCQLQNLAETKFVKKFFKFRFRRIPPKLDKFRFHQIVSLHKKIQIKNMFQKTGLKIDNYRTYILLKTKINSKKLVLSKFS